MVSIWTFGLFSTLQRLQATWPIPRVDLTDRRSAIKHGLIIQGSKFDDFGALKHSGIHEHKITAGRAIVIGHRVTAVAVTSPSASVAAEDFELVTGDQRRCS